VSFKSSPGRTRFVYILIGKRLLKATFDLAREMAERTGCVGVVVDAKTDAIEFYKRYGFESLDVLLGKLGDRPVPQPMFLPLGSIPNRS